MIAITRKEFKQLADFIEANYGIHLKEEKKSLLIGRLSNLLTEKNFKNFSRYYDYITNDKTGTAATALINKITTNHTYFMRETEHFQFLKERVLPYLSEKIKNRDLRIWSAGCSSGEEPYTLAMILDEFFGYEKSNWDTKVLATDISTKVLDKAKKGLYSREDLAPLPAYWRLNYFNKVDNENYALVEKIKNEVIFRKFNLMDKVYPFKRKFHVIFCRNVMIYFDHQTKTELANKFYQHLENGGYLFIGQSESLNRQETKYKCIMPAVYRKE